MVGGGHARPQLEGQRPLVDEHRQPAERPQPPAARLGQEGRALRRVHDVDGERAGPGAFERDGDARGVGATMHADRGTVHDAIVLPERATERLSGNGPAGAANLPGEPQRTFVGPVGDGHSGRVRLYQRERDPAGGAACTDQQHALPGRVEHGLRLERGHEPGPIGVEPEQAPLAVDDGVHRAHARTLAAELVQKRDDRLFVGDGHIRAKHVLGPERGDPLRQLRRRCIPALVHHIEAAVREGRGLERRRERVGYRVPDDPHAPGHCPPTVAMFRSWSANVTANACDPSPFTASATK